MGGQEKYTGPRKSGMIDQLTPTQGYRVQPSGDDMASAGKGGPQNVNSADIGYGRERPDTVNNPNWMYGRGSRDGVPKSYVPPVQAPEIGIDPRPLPERIGPEGKNPNSPPANASLPFMDFKEWQRQNPRQGSEIQVVYTDPTGKQWGTRGQYEQYLDYERAKREYEGG